MSRREEILRRAEQLRREEEKLKKYRKGETRAYSASGMNRERMPLGCWLWIIGIVAAVVFFLSKGVLH